MPTSPSACALCQELGGELVWQTPFLRVLRVPDADHPAYFRVVLQQHVVEMTDLPDAERDHLMQTVFLVERVLRQRLSPAKINLASFGNVTPHVHWHVIARWPDDAHFPQPVWGERQRPGVVRTLDGPALMAAMASALLTQPPLHKESP